MSINKQHLMLMGARSRLVELESERVQLLKMFPELELPLQQALIAKRVDDKALLKKAKKKHAKHAAAKRVHRKAKKRSKQGDRMEGVALLASKSEKIDAVSVAKALDVTRERASNLLHAAKAQGIVKRIARGVYEAAS